MIKLFEVNEALMKAFDEETGELLISEEELDEIFRAEENGINYFLALYKNSLATAEAYANEAKALKARADACKKIAERAFNRLEQHMEGKPYESEVGKISYRKSTKCECVNKEAFDGWDDRFSYGSAEFKANVNDIKTALKNGEFIPGFALVDYNNMSIK